MQQTPSKNGMLLFMVQLLRMSEKSWTLEVWCYLVSSDSTPLYIVYYVVGVLMGFVCFQICIVFKKFLSTVDKTSFFALNNA